MENPYIDQADRPVVRLNVEAEEFRIFMLAKAGWCGGNPMEIQKMPIDDFMKSYDFEIMSRQYKNTAYEMSKKSQ